ncbi:9727_t:CDS:10 [Funneliformis caledonium]|uniref:9727_t:CDS:1 n=1 Tax=Funneliformis caledonium TaxID=1117310 RepID=A0A9N8ZYV8_9GLOM|nr:9727_t:CDS:10 [Funneliformis caledonium]
MYSKRKRTASVEAYPSGRAHSFTDRLPRNNKRVISSITKTVMRSDKRPVLSIELRLHEALKDDPNSDKLLSLKRKWENDEYMYDWDAYEDEKKNRKVDQISNNRKNQEIKTSSTLGHLDNRLKANSPTGGNQTNNILVPQSTEFTDILHKTGEDQTQVQVNNDDAGFFDDLDEGNERNDEIEDIADNILSSFVSEDKSSVLKNLENRLATTYKVVSHFDRQFPYTKELYNTFPDQMRTLENEWEKVEANIQKTTEERWNVSKMKELVDKYYKIIIDHFDELLDVDHKKLITVFSKPPYDDFSYKRDDELIWCQRIFIDLTRQFLRNRGALFDKEASELRYRSEIVNPLLAGAFEMIERSIWLETGETENEIQKVQRNDTKENKERSKIGMKHDGVINMIIHGKKYQVGFLEVVGNAFNNDITDRNIDLEKLYKAMSLSLWNQRAHLDNETSQQLSTFAVLVHGKIFSFLSMHYINNEFVVKNYDDFILPTINECLVRLPKIIETIANSRIMIYHREHIANFHKVVRSPSDNPPNASPQKKRNNGGRL